MNTSSLLKKSLDEFRKKNESRVPATPSILKKKPENYDENGASYSKQVRITPTKANKSVRIGLAESRYNAPKTPQPLRKRAEMNHDYTPEVPSTPAPVVEADAESEIKVYLRQRPLLSGEEHADFDIDENCVIARPTQKGGSSTHYAERKFTFTEVFPEESKQEDLFDVIAMPLLKKFIRGYDGLLFAYGATSAGKTFTVRGTEENPGLIPQIVRTLLGVEQPRDAERGLFVSCVEVYNERIHDLLGDSKVPMRIGKDAFGFTVVKNVSEVEIKRIDDLKQILATMDKAKSVCATSFNANSSRSHCIFMLKLISIPVDPRTRQRVNDLSKIKASRLSIVDLAGSERVSPTETSSKMVSEACNINKSMLVLGRCIRDIRKIRMGVKGLQVPYRESKITELFRDFFDPVTSRKTYCSIIINISPATKQFDDTLFALQFAAEAVECSVRSTEPDDDDDDEDLIMKKIDGEEEQEEKDLIDFNDISRIHQEMTERCRKIHQELDNSLTEIRAHSGDTPSKLQEMLAQKARKEQYKKALEEARRELARLQTKEKELDEKIEDVETKTKRLMEGAKEIAQRNQSAKSDLENMEMSTRKLEDGLLKIHQRLVDLKAQFKKEYEDEMNTFNAKYKELQ